MSIAGVDTGRVLPDPVSMIVMETRSEVGGMAFTPVSIKVILPESGEYHLQPLQ